MKVSLPLDKREWHPSVLPGQIVLVSTVDVAGRPNVAPKSWVTLAAFGGPIVGFGCNVGHATYRNAIATEEFVVNVLPARLAELAWALPDVHGDQRLRGRGLALARAQSVRAPLVEECPAHLECGLDDVKRYDEEVFIFGRVVAASIDEDCIEGSLAERYERLAPAFFLESGVYAGLGPPRQAG